MRAGLCHSSTVEALVAMGYNRQEIEDSLSQVRYDDVFATYLLLGRKNTDVSLFCCLSVSVSVRLSVCRLSSCLVFLPPPPPLRRTRRSSREREQRERVWWSVVRRERITESTAHTPHISFPPSFPRTRFAHIRFLSRCVFRFRFVPGVVSFGFSFFCVSPHPLFLCVVSFRWRSQQQNQYNDEQNVSLCDASLVRRTFPTTTHCLLSRILAAARRGGAAAASLPGG